MADYKQNQDPVEGREQERREKGSRQKAAGVGWGSLSLGSLSPFGDCFPGSLEPEEDGMFLSLPRGKSFFFLHKNVKLHNPIGNLDRLQLAAWVLLLGTLERGREMGGQEGLRGVTPVEQEQGQETREDAKGPHTLPA